MKTEIEIDTWTNGKKRREIPYVNGQRHGLATLWYLNGQKNLETPYVNGQKRGLDTGWFSDGSLGYVEKWHQDQKVWSMNFPFKGEIPENAEVELFFHETPELK